MAVAINTSGQYTMTRVDNADTATGWSVTKIEGSGGAPSLLASVGTIDLVAEGTDARAARTNKQRVSLQFTNAAGYDFTSGSTGSGATKVPSGIATVWALFLAAGSLFTKANGGMQILLGDGTNTSYWNVGGSDTYSGGFEKWAALTTVSPSETSGTAANLGDITVIGFVTDVGTAVTRFDNFVVDAIDVGDGLEFNGTTVSNTMFAEALAADEATAIGIMSEKNGKIFSQGNLRFSGTSMVSESESLTFTDTLGGAYTYKCDFTGTITLTNSNIDQDGAVDFDYDTTGATSFTHNGGVVKGFNTVTTNVGDTISGVVFQSGGTSSIGSSIESTWNDCGKITVTGDINNSTVNKSTATEAVSASSTTKAAGVTFIKDTSASHAFELTGAAGSYSWSGKLTGYDAGSTGNGVQVTGGSITGNEAIHITATTGTFNISVADGADIPSVSSAGAVVNVTSGGATFTATVSPIPSPNYEWRLYTVTAVGSLDGSVEIDGAENETGGSIIYPHTFTNQPVCLQIISDDYVERNIFYTFTSSDLTVTVDLEVDDND